jgi:hypothetical protein
MKIQHPDDANLFTIWVDPNARLVRFKVAKLWSKEIFDCFNQALFVELKKLQDTGLSFDMIGDLTQFPPQPQFLNEGRQDVYKMMKEMGLRKRALIVVSVLAKHQTDRLSTDSYKSFAREREALAWIAE